MFAVPKKDNTLLLTKKITMSTDTLGKFLDAQNQVYLNALQEIGTGRKTSHWMWYVFPQIKGLGKSDTAKFYSIALSAYFFTILKNTIRCPNFIGSCQKCPEVFQFLKQEAESVSG